ncbi:MAG: KEOPS complex subunit Pcc1 [Candidatus Hodarchaeota archaeon]
MLIKIKMRKKEEAQIICNSIKPDNISKPPMVIHSTYKTNKIIITIKNVGRIETASATINDLLYAWQAAENMINIGDSC